MYDFAALRSITNKRDDKMESRRVLVLVLLVVMAIALMSSTSSKGVEAVVIIEMNPCFKDQCIAACKDHFKEKFISATCSKYNNVQFCLCFG